MRLSLWLSVHPASSLPLGANRAPRGAGHLLCLLSPCDHETRLHLRAMSRRWHFLKFTRTGLSCLLYCFYSSLSPIEFQSNPSGTPYMYFGIQIIFISKFCGHHSLCSLLFSFCFCMISRWKGVKWGEAYLFMWLYSDQKSCFWNQPEIHVLLISFCSPFLWLNLKPGVLGCK